MSRQKSSERFRFTAAALLLSGLVFLLPALRGGNPSLYLLAVLVPCVMLLCGTMLARMFAMDRMILSLVLWLCVSGIAALAPSDPDRALTQSVHCCAALVAFLVGGIIIRALAPSLLTAACTAFLGLLALAGKLFSASLDLPLTEIALAILMISFASLLARQGTIYALVLGIAVLTLLLVRGSAVDAALWGLAVLFLIFAADGRLQLVIPAIAAMALLFFGAFRLFSVPVLSQETDTLPVLVSAGAVGADTLPDGISLLDPDSLFPFMVGHYGMLFAGFTVMLFLPLFLRGSAVAVSARTRFHAVLAMGCSLLLSLRALTALLSMFGIFPLPGLRIPFLTFSLPDLCAQLFLAGLLCGVSGRNDADLAEDAHLAMLAK